MENTTPVNFNNLTFNGTATNNITNSTLTTVNNITLASGAGAYTLNATVGSAGASGGPALAVTGNIVNNFSNLQTTAYEKRKAEARFRRRAAIEVRIGHLKSKFRLGRTDLPSKKRGGAFC